MIDFLKQGARDPQLYVKYAKSYFNFAVGLEDSLKGQLGSKEIKLLELFANEINNSKRVEESVILKMLLNHKILDTSELKSFIQNEYGYSVQEETINSCVKNLNFTFIKEIKDNKAITVQEKYDIHVIEKSETKLSFDPEFATLLLNPIFYDFLQDNINYSIREYNRTYHKDKFDNGFVYYRKYSRKDVFRILNWDDNPIAQNVGGYMISRDKTNCPIFVTYHKDENISSTTKYEDGFLSNIEFEWMSKSKRNLKSPDVQTILNAENNVRLPLFIQKSNDEGIEFYYMGDIIPKINSAEETTMPDENGKPVSVVKIKFSMKYPVEDSIYEYITMSNIDILKKKTPESTSIQTEPYPFKILATDDIIQYKNCVPLYEISVAAGDFSETQVNSNTTWIQLPSPYKYSEDYFVCKVHGESMNKIIPSNSWCLFKKDPGGSRQGKIVLVQHVSIQDADYGSGFTIKLYESKKAVNEVSWHHESIILKPKSNDSHYQDIILQNDDLVDVKVVGIFVAILQ